MEKKNYNTEWLFNELGRILDGNTRGFMFFGLNEFKPYFATMTPEQEAKWRETYRPYVKNMPGYMFHMFLRRELDNHGDLWVNVILRFGDDLAWVDESGEVHFNNDCHRFAIRYRDNDGWLTLSNTFDLTDRGIWVCGHTTCHIAAGGGNYRMPTCILERPFDFLDAMFEERDLWEHLTSTALAQKERYEPEVEIWIVDDTNP